MNLSIKNNKLKAVVFSILGLAIVVAALVFYQKKIRYNLVTITENKVYNSGAIPPNELKGFVDEHKIKTIVDLRDGLIQTELNPESKDQVNAEKVAADKISGVHYYNLPVDQVPPDSMVQKFLTIMDNPANYPVLIHCHHGVGRSRLFSSIYRIEYENFTNDDARKNARFFWEFGTNFSKTSEKGTYLLNYKKRPHE